MAFIATQSNLQQYQGIKTTARNLRALCQSWISRSLAGDIAVEDVRVQLLPSLLDAINRLGTPSAELVQVARDQEGDQNYDAAGEFMTLKSTVEGARDWLIANLPQDASGNLRERVIQPGGSTTLVKVTPAQTAGFRTQLQAVVDQVQV